MSRPLCCDAHLYVRLTLNQSNPNHEKHLITLFTSILSLVATPLVAQPYTWVGGGGEFINYFSSSNNWDVMPNWGVAEYRDYIFGQSSSGYYGRITQDISTNFWAKSLTFDETAGDSYIIEHESIYVEAGGVLRNLSGYEQRIESEVVFPTGTYPYHIYTGKAGIVLAGGTSKIGDVSFRNIVQKYGMGALTLAGSHDIDTLIVRQGQIIFDGNDTIAGNLALTRLTYLVFQGMGEMGYQGGNELVVLGNSGNQTTDISMRFGHADFWGSMNTYGAVKIRLDSQGGDGTNLTFTNWLVSYGDSAYRRHTLHFDLIGDSSVHIDAVSDARVMGIENVANWATVSTSSTTNGPKVTGFMQLVGDAINGYEVARYQDYTALPDNQSALTGGHYYVDGSHTMSGTIGDQGNAPRTLTLMGSGTLAVTDGNFYIANILLQEGLGDYTIDLPTGSLDFDIWDQRLGTMTLHQYRTTGNLIIAADLTAWQLVTTGPGKTILRSNSAHSNLVELLVQEGFLQLESNALSTLTQIGVYGGALGGSGQIGSSSATVNIYHGGAIDATPGTHISESGLRGLQIYGSLNMNEDSTLAIALTADVLAGNYDPLRVTTSSPLNNVVDLNGNLQVTLNGHFSGERWIVLLETNGLIDGLFDSVNGESFGASNHFVLTYGGIDYDFYLHYDYDVGGGSTALALQAIPEPSTVALLAGAVGIVVWVCRRRGLRK